MVKDICDNCALRLYNTKSHRLEGVGNPWSGNCIVVPNVDYNAYKKGSMSFSSQVEVIKDILHLSTGVEDSNLFIVPLIRCNESISCKLDNISYNKCLHWFVTDMRKYQFKNIMLLGDAARRFLHCNISDNLKKIFISRNDKRYVVNYSPLISYVNNELFDVFKERLIHWNNCINYGIYAYEFNMIGYDNQ